MTWRMRLRDVGLGVVLANLGWIAVFGMWPSPPTFPAPAFEPWPLVAQLFNGADAGPVCVYTTDGQRVTHYWTKAWAGERCPDAPVVWDFVVWQQRATRP